MKKKKKDIPQFPYVHWVRVSPFTGIFLLIFALPLLWLVIMGVRSDIINDTVDAGTLGFALFFGLLDLGVFVAVFEYLFGGSIIRFTETAVTYRRFSLFKHTRWTEPLTNYRGVLRSSVVRRSGSRRQGNTSYHTDYLLTLSHMLESKNIVLFDSRSPRGQRATWEWWARLLNKPAIDLTDHGEMTRDVNDLDVSVRELVKRGTLPVSFDRSQSPPKGVHMKDTGDALILTTPKTRWPLIVSLMAVVVPLSIMYHGGLFTDVVPVDLRIAGPVIGAGCVLIVLWIVLTKQRLHVSAEQVVLGIATPLGMIPTARLNADDIEQVEMTSSFGKGSGVVICTDEHEKTVGSGLPHDTLLWLHDCIIAMISQ